jgi:hypothetical protein
VVVAMARFLAGRPLFPGNRRDGSRLLSSALVICCIGLVRLDHPAGQLLALLAGLVSLYWWRCYQHLQS